MKISRSIEVVRTSVRGRNSMSPTSAQAIVDSLAMQYSHVTLTTISTPSDLEALIKRKPDLAFLGMARIGEASEEVWLSEQLEAAGIAHTGSLRGAHELEHRKDSAKQHILKQGIATAPFRVVLFDAPLSTQQEDLPFPLFVKPIGGGGGQGVDEASVVHTPQQLRDKIAALQLQLQTDVLVEQYLDGREFSIAIIADKDSGKHLAMPLELIAPKDSRGQRMLGRRVKSSNEEQAIVVADPTLRAQIGEFGLAAFTALGARDYGRIDIRLDSKGKPHFLEANLIPSLIEGYGSFPKAYLLSQGVEYNEMIRTIAQLGFART